MPAVPLLADTKLTNAVQLRGKIVVVRHGGGSFHEIARWVQTAGAVALAVIDKNDAPGLGVRINAEADDIAIPLISVGNNIIVVANQRCGLKRCSVLTGNLVGWPGWLA